MKLFLSVISLIVSTTALAKTVSSSQVQVSPSAVDQVIQLVNKSSSNGGEMKVTVLVEKGGLSTDFSPRYTLYLSIASFAEMGNITADFVIANAYEFLSARRKAPGIYEIQFVDYRTNEENTSRFEVTYTIDATQVFSDEKKQRAACGGDFCDVDLKTSVNITETIKK